MKSVVVDTSKVYPIPPSESIATMLTYVASTAVVVGGITFKQFDLSWTAVSNVNHAVLVRYRIKSSATNETSEWSIPEISYRTPFYDIYVREVTSPASEWTYVKSVFTNSSGPLQPVAKVTSPKTQIQYAVTIGLPEKRLLSTEGVLSGGNPTFTGDNKYIVGATVALDTHL